MTSTTSSGIFDNIKRIISPNDLALAFAVLMIIALLIVPMPPLLVDLLMALNIALAIGIVLISMFIPKPMDFSIFPTILLFTTLLRLGINISTSRLILLEGEAGKVVTTFGGILLGGNYIIGVVIFLMIMAIQFMVINSGVGRIAEVGARFTLDAMPGKQMAIDADLNSGLIDEHEAVARREEIQDEADFYGAMDGATKFVSGDTKAAIIVMLVNILGGIATGMLVRNMDAMTALQTYTLYTIGAGLAIQIPALLISMAAGLVVTRSTEASLGDLVFKQFSNFNVLAIASLFMLILMLIPGMPKLPFIIVAAILGGAAFLVRKQTAVEEEIPSEVAEPVVGKQDAETPEDMLSMVMVDPVELEIGYGLIPLIDDSAPDNLLRRITGLRRQLMNEIGFILPIVRIRDNLRLAPPKYIVKIRGQEVAQGELLIERLLAIPGAETREELQGTKTVEPAFGLPAYWITEPERGRAELMGYTVVPPISVISTHLLEIFRAHASQLLDRQMVKEMIDQVKSRAPASVEGIIPEMLSLGDLQSILRNLLKERLPIRDIQGILEVIANNALATKDTNILAEAVRQSMSNTISSMYRDDNNFLHVFTLSPQIESILRESIGITGKGIGFQIDASLAQSILEKTSEQMEKLAQSGYLPILLCPREIRLAFRAMSEPILPNLITMAYSEVSSGTKVRTHGMVDLKLTPTEATQRSEKVPQKA